MLEKANYTNNMEVSLHNLHNYDVNLAKIKMHKQLCGQRLMVRPIKYYCFVKSRTQWNVVD